MFHTLAALSYTPTTSRTSSTNFRTSELSNFRTSSSSPCSTSGRVLTHAIRAAVRRHRPSGLRPLFLSRRPADAYGRRPDVAHAARGRARHSLGHASSFLRVLPSRTTLRLPPARQSGVVQRRRAYPHGKRNKPDLSQSHPRASAQRRACKVSGIPLSNAAAPPPFPPAGTAARDTRASAAPFPCPRPSRLRGVACGSVRLEIPVRRHPARGRKRELIGQPAKSGEALQKASIPRGKRGVWNSVQGSGSARLGRAARLFRFLPAAGAAERGGI